jgi:hypothetical protein
MITMFAWSMAVFPLRRKEVYRRWQPEDWPLQARGRFGESRRKKAFGQGWQSGNQLPGVGVLGVAEDFFRGTGFDELAGLEDGNAVAEGRYGQQIMRDKEDGHV